MGRCTYTDGFIEVFDNRLRMYFRPNYPSRVELKVPTAEAVLKVFFGGTTALSVR